MDVINGSLVAAIMAYEDGRLDPTETLHLFSRLLKLGMISRLQGSYGRVAHSLIDSGAIDITTYEVTDYGLQLADIAASAR